MFSTRPTFYAWAHAFGSAGVSSALTFSGWDTLAQLSPEQIRDAFALGYTPDEVEGFSKVVEGRIAQLNKL